MIPDVVDALEKSSSLSSKNQTRTRGAVALRYVPSTDGQKNESDGNFKKNIGSLG